MNWMGLGFLFQAKDQASAIIRQIEGSLGSLEGSAATAGKAIASAFVAAKTFSMGLDTMKDAFGLAEEAGKFQQKLGYLKATAGGTVEQFEAMRETAIKMGLTTFFSPTKAVEGMTALAQEGYSAADSIKKVGDALRFAGVSLGQLTPETAAGFFAKIERSFGESDANRIANISAKMAKMSAINFGEIPGMFSRAQRGAKLDQSFASTAAALMIAKNFITSSETASTSMGDVQLSLTEGKKNRVLQQMSGVDFKDSRGKYRPFLEIMADIDASPMWNRLDKQSKDDVLTKMFGRRQQATLDGLFKTIRNGFTDQDTGRIYKGAEGMRDFVAALEKAQQENVIGEYELERLNTFGGQLDMLRTKFETIRVNILGEAFADAFRPIALVLNRVLEGVGTFLASVPEELKAAAAGAFMLATAFATAAAGIALIVSGVIGFGALMSAVGGTILLAVGPPILLAMGLVTALGVLFGATGAALYAGWTENINGMKDSIQGFFAKVQLGFQVLKQLFAEGGTWGDVDEQIMDTKNSGLRDFLMDVWVLMGRVKNFGIGLWEGFKTALMEMSGPLGGLMSSLNDVLGVFSSAGNTAADNEAAFRNWGKIGRELGEILADLANIGLTLLTEAVGLLIDALQAGKDIMASFGYGGKFGSSQALADAKLASAAMSGDPERFSAAWQGSEKTKLKNFWMENNAGKGFTKEQFEDWVDSNTGFSGLLNFGAIRFGGLRDELKQEGMPQDNRNFYNAGPNLATVGPQSLLSGAAPAPTQTPAAINFAPTTVVKIGDDAVGEFMQRYQRDSDARGFNAYAPVIAGR